MPRRDGPDVAIPYDEHPGALVEYKAQPATPVRLGCPNCGSTTLVYVEEAMIERDLEAVWDVGVTEPEIEVQSYDDALVLDAPAPKPRGVRCEACRWAFTGRSPLNRLTRLA